MSSKSSASRAKYTARVIKAKATKESQKRYRSTPTTQNLADSLVELKASVTELIARVEAIDRKLSAFTAQTIPLNQQDLQGVTQSNQRLSQEDLGWLRLAESSFAFWDNEEDAVYDHL